MTGSSYYSIPLNSFRWPGDVQIYSISGVDKAMRETDRYMRRTQILCNLYALSGNGTIHVGSYDSDSRPPVIEEVTITIEDVILKQIITHIVDLTKEIFVLALDGSIWAIPLSENGLPAGDPQRIIIGSDDIQAYNFTYLQGENGSSTFMVRSVDRLYTVTTDGQYKPVTINGNIIPNGDIICIPSVGVEFGAFDVVSLLVVARPDENNPENWVYYASFNITEDTLTVGEPLNKCGALSTGLGYISPDLVLSTPPLSENCTFTITQASRVRDSYPYPSLDTSGGRNGDWNNHTTSICTLVGQSMNFFLVNNNTDILPYILIPSNSELPTLTYYRALSMRLKPVQQINTFQRNYTKLPFLYTNYGFPPSEHGEYLFA